MPVKVKYRVQHTSALPISQQSQLAHEIALANDPPRAFGRSNSYLQTAQKLEKISS